MRARDLIRSSAPSLAAAGIDTAKLDAELLVAHVLGIERQRLFIDDPELDASQLAQARRLLAARAEERTPVAYLTRSRWFDELELHVDPRVLVPRPETELLVELAAVLAPRDATVIDVGTGSGAIAISLARRRPDLRITASDIDEAALEVARENAVRHLGAGAALTFQHASLLGDWAGEVVLSNPPYVEETTRDALAPELGHEPQHALYAGVDGLDVIRPLIAQCRDRHAGLVVIEHGNAQGAAVRALFEAAGYRAATERDLAGHDRITWALRADLWPPSAAQRDAMRRLG